MGGEINPGLGGALEGRARNADITQSTRRQFQQLGSLQEAEIKEEAIVPSPDVSALKVTNAGTLKQLVVSEGTKVGQFLAIRFGAAATVSTAGNIILLGNRPMKAALNDVLFVQCDGEHWRELGRREATAAEELAAAATISPTPTVTTIKVEGATPITKINATYNGHLLALRFGGNVTLKSENNLKLAAAEIAATNNDVLLLLCNGANWYQCAPLSANA